MNENSTAILFDFDGVLADTEPIHWQCWNEALRAVGLEVTWENYRRHCVGISDRDFLARLGALAQPPRSVDELLPFYPLKKKLFAGRATCGSLIDPELKSLLHRLPPGRLAVVTSSSRQEIEPILRAEGILERFGTAVYGDDVRRLKPDPEPYRLAMQRLGAHRAIVLEDSAAGIESALRAGCEVIEVRDPREVPRLLRQRLALTGNLE
ncbi:MAG: HAD family hydrolase [Bryobacteraceae bacterium]